MPVMKKPGCGVLAAFLLVVVILVMLGSNEAVGYYMDKCDPEEDIFDCLMSGLEEEEEPAAGTVAATSDGVAPQTAGRVSTPRVRGRRPEVSARGGSAGSAGAAARHRRWGGGRG